MPSNAQRLASEECGPRLAAHINYRLSTINRGLLIEQVGSLLLPTMNSRQQDSASLLGLPGSVASGSSLRSKTSWPRLSSDLEEVKLTDSEPDDDVFLPGGESSRGLNLSRVKTIHRISLILPKEGVKKSTRAVSKRSTTKNRFAQGSPLNKTSTSYSSKQAKNGKDLKPTDLQDCGPFQEKTIYSGSTIILSENPECGGDMYRQKNMETACVEHIVLHRNNNCCRVQCSSCL